MPDADSAVPWGVRITILLRQGAIGSKDLETLAREVSLEMLQNEGVDPALASIPPILWWPF